MCQVETCRGYQPIRYERAVRLEVPRASPMPRSTAMYTSAILPSWPTQVLHIDMKTSQTSLAPATILPRGQRRTLRRSRLSALPYTISSSTLPTPTAAIAMGRVKAVCYDVVFLQRRKTLRKKTNMFSQITSPKTLCHLVGILI